METERIFAKYGTLIIDITHQQCMFIKGDYPTDYDKPDIVINDVPIKYINFGIPLDNILIFHDPHADQSLYINDRPIIKVRYDAFSVVMHNDPDNPRSYMDFRNVELLTPFDYAARRFSTWEEYDAAQERIRELTEEKSDFDQMVEYIQKMGREKTPKKQPMRASICSEEGITIYDYKFFVRWHTQPEPTWGVYEEMKAYVFDDESRINIFMLRSGREIKDQTMYKWSLMFDQRGNMIVEELPVAYTLEPSRPCADLSYFIATLATKKNGE